MAFPTTLDRFVDGVSIIFAKMANQLQNILVGPAWFNVKSADYGALGDGTTDDTAAIQSAITAASNAGGGVVFLPKGTYVIDIQGGTVGSGGVQLKYCLYLPSNVWLRGAGAGVTIIQLKTVTRTPNVTGFTQFMVANQHPDLTTDHDIFVSDLTLDGNRANQGPYAYFPLSLAVAASNLVYCLGFYGGVRMGADHIEVINCSQFAIYIENNASNLTFGQIRARNCVASFAIDAGANITLSQISVINSDPAYVVNTTATTTVAGGGAVTVTPVSMAGIAVNGVLDIAIGTSVNEFVLVTGVTGTTFTAYFANAHGPGSYAINDARFKSDSAVQPGPLALRVSCGLIDVDYTAALHVVSAAVEIFGAKEIAVASVVTRGTLFGLWIHNWFINPTLYVPRDITIGTVTVVNCVVSATGQFPVGIWIDDQGFVTYPTQTVTNVSIASATIHNGAGGVGVATQHIGMDVRANVRGLAVGELVIDGGVHGMYLRGCQTNTFGAVAIRNQNNEAVNLNNACVSNSFASLTVDNTGLTNGAFGQAVVTDATAVSKNIINGITATQIPAASYVIDLNGSTGNSNYFNGSIAGNTLLVRSNGNFQGFHLSGGPLTRSLQSPAFAASLTIDATLGEIVNIGALTANITINAPTNPFMGQTLTLIFTQDATGGRTATWNAAFKTAFQPARVASAISSVSFEYDGTNWQQMGGQVAMDQSGNITIPGHWISVATGTPSTTNLGANVTSVTFTGNDTRGTIAIVMSAGLAANTRVCTATFAVSYGATSPKVTLVDQTSTAGLAIVNSYVQAQATGVSFDLAFDQALVAGTYTIDYIVIG